MMFLDDLEYCLERILCLYMDLYIRVAYLIDWIHNMLKDSGVVDF